MPAPRHFGPVTGPRTIFLPAGGALLVQETDNGLTCSQIAGGDTICLSGKFAAGLSALLAGNPDNRQLAILNLLCQQYPWLQGLTQASARPEKTSAFLLGQGLGVLFIEMTARCNERCLHCYAEAGPERSESLSLQKIHGILVQAKAFGCPTVQFTGGDPLIHPDLIKAVKVACELDFSDIEIYTNGLLLSSRMLARLAPFSPRFAFSVYSHEAAIHDRITRVPGSFRRTLAAVRRAKGAGLGVRVGVTIMPENLNHEQNIRRFIETEIKLPPSDIHFARIKGVGRGGNRSGASPTDANRAGYHDRPNVPEKRRPPAAANQRHGKLCVAADGNIYPCIFARHTLLGNIHRQELAEIMQALDQRLLPEPSAPRWERCRQTLACRDCQMIAYALGMESEYATA